VLLLTAAPASAVPNADVAVQLTDAPDPVAPGGQIQYTATVTSEGPSSASNVELTVGVPAAATSAIASFPSNAPCVFSPQARVVCQLGTMPKGKVVSVQVVIGTIASSQSPITNFALVKADEDSAPGNNTATETTTVSSSTPPAPPPPQPPPPPGSPPPAPPPAAPQSPPATAPPPPTTTVVAGAVAPDRTPPAQVSGVRATTGNRSVVVRWRSPSDPDFQRVVLTRSQAGGPKRVVYSGNREQFTDRGLRNGVRYLYVLRSLDWAGNASAGVRFAARPTAMALYSPQPNAPLSAPPVLRWRPVAGASYYNLQLYRGTTKVLTAWPRSTSLRLHARWVFEGRRIRLAPGVYHWFVWPGRGPRSRSSYGPLLGRNSFVIVPPKSELG
jgi:Domain of unknown function DUF11